ncbi:hypothetical protein BDB01DRAFT_808174, partial [Pilobolus umbonatus]
MTDLLQLSHNDFYHVHESNEYSYNPILLPQHKNKKLSLSGLLQRTPTLLGRRFSRLSPQKKAGLTVIISPEENKDGLHRTYTMTTTASSNTNDSHDDGLDTPPLSPMYHIQNTHINSDDVHPDIETAATTIDANAIRDYSGKGYSNFYVKLPNGDWMVRIRDGQRKIIATYKIDSSM